MTPSAPDPLAELVRKVDAIYIALFGMDGQPGTGRVSVLERRVNDHSKRISSLERWRFYVLGAVAMAFVVLGIVLRLAH